MKKNIIRIIGLILGGALGFYALPPFLEWLPFELPSLLNNAFVHIALGAFILYIIARLVEDQIAKQIERLESLISDLDVSYLLFGAVGMIIGLILAWLINMSLMGLQIPFISNVLPVVIMVLLAYLGFSIMTSRREEIRRIFMNRNVTENETTEEGILQRKADENFRQYKVLDTSVIIDGRIKDVLETGFLEGTLVITDFVLRELQHIADSSDSLKRERGRRGLDILNDLQNDPKFKVEMYDKEVNEVEAVDEKLVVLAKRLDGVLVTNDYNLNKVAEFQNVPVLNVNDLANSVKPVVIAGEEMTITIVKEGTERSQGVGYLSDGTMVIVEDGKYFMNEAIEVVVTSTLQTSAGRMIFTRPAHSQKGIDDKKS